MAGNSNLNDSARNKQDEFYTQLSMVENELKHYKEHFNGNDLHMSPSKNPLLV